MREGTKARMPVGLSLAACALIVACGLSPADGPERIEIAGVENAFRLGPNLYSGSQPEGAKGFQALRDLGVKTILSVDGSRPDAALAARHGLGTVHLPIGYDGIPRSQAVRIVLAARTLPGPIFIHCHHGQHRGPAAAAVCAIDEQGWSREEARAWLESAGTSTDYRGLYETVAKFTVPTAAELEQAAGEFPEQAEPEAMTDAMVAIDARWDWFRKIQKAEYQAPLERPAVEPAHEALLLAEQFREAARLPEAIERGPAYVAALDEAGRLALQLKAALERREGEGPDARAPIDAAFNAVGKSCKPCHARYRNP